MVFDPRAYLTIKLQQQERLQAAAQQRLVKQALEAHQGTRQFYSSLLARLGRWLIAWGWRLQMRYGTESTLPDLSCPPPDSMRSLSKMI